MSNVQLSDQGQDQGCKIQNKIQEPCKPTNTSPEERRVMIAIPRDSALLR